MAGSAVPLPNALVRALPSHRIAVGWLPVNVVLEAPADGLSYARRNNGWIATGGAGGTGFNQTIGDGAATSIVVTHSLGTRDVHVQVYDTSTFDDVYPGISRTTINSITLGFTVAPALNALRVVIIPSA